MSTPSIGRQRLVNLQIAKQPHRTVEQAVTALGALQAQDFAGAKWAIGLRLPGATEADIDRAIAERAIVRSWPMRGTLHFVAAADLRWMLRLLNPRIVAGSAGRWRQLGIDDQIYARAVDVMARALAGGRQLTREALCLELERAGIATAGQRGYHLIGRAAQEGVICFGLHAGRQPTMVLLDEWLPPGRDFAGEEALAELAARYFRGHGPATVEDFARWAGLKLSDARLGLRAAAGELARETIDGKEYWRPELDSLPESGVHLLPSFDEFLLGYKDRDAVLDPAHSQKIVPGNNGMFQPTLVVDGRVAGTWKRQVKRSKVRLTVTPFAPLDPSLPPQLDAAAERYGAFLGLPVELAVE